MLVSDPKSLALALPPPIFWTAIGINVRPITVISVPVTTGGKRRLTLENWSETKQTKDPSYDDRPIHRLDRKLAPDHF